MKYIWTVYRLDEKYLLYICDAESCHYIRGGTITPKKLAKFISNPGNYGEDVFTKPFWNDKTDAKIGYLEKASRNQGAIVLATEARIWNERLTIKERNEIFYVNH